MLSRACPLLTLTDLAMMVEKCTKGHAHKGVQGAVICDRFQLEVPKIPGGCKNLQHAINL